MKKFSILALLLILTACGGRIIKINKTILSMMMSGSNKVSEAVTYADSCEHKTGIHYAESERQVVDIYYAKENRQNAVLIDIHGGFYIAGDRRNNRAFASEFLKKGFDVVLLEYRLCDGMLDVETELEDCAAALDYLATNAEALGLNPNKMFLTGDSAGGHLALYMAEGAEDPALPVHPTVFKPQGVLLNCPAYNFASYASLNGGFTDDALAWFIGPKYKDTDWMTAVSPRSHLTSYTGPLFVSTCTYDFIRAESLTLQADCKAAGRALTFVDIASPSRQVGHVHNVIDTSLPESRDVNARMVQFMEENL